MWTSRRCISIGVLSLILATASWGLSASAAEPLFACDDVLHLTIHGPLTSLARGTPGSTDVRGSLELADGRMIPMTFSRYGLSRLCECGLPSFKITIAEEDARGTIFEGQSTLRLVTPCQYGSSFDRYILLEYLVYESFAVITEPALQTRLVSCRFRDSEKPAFEEIGLAFFVEDIGLAANRHGKTWLAIRSQRVADLDPAQLALMALFQFMVGNTDWSALSSAAGQPCCHNVAVLGAEGDKHNTLLPFDFDQAGLVDAPYAAPDERLKIQRVTQRVYRGYCSHNDEIPAAIAIFNEKRPELEELVNENALPNPQARKRALKYIDAFYTTINNPRKVESRIVSECR
jgi:hypothetical protein